MVDISERIAKMQSGITNRIAKGLTRGWIRTIEDLEKATYGFTTSELLQKDAPVITSTTGARNVLVGARLWQQIQTQANAFGAIGAKPWDKSGYRALTAAAATTSPAISEAGAIPATIKPTIAELTVPPGVSAGSFDMSSTQMKLAGKDDVVEWPDLVEYMGKEFKNRLNRAVLADADTTVSTGLDTLDRVIASYAELAYGKVADGAVLDASDLDIYSQNRDGGASWVDAYVSGQAFASGSRDLALTHIDAGFTNTRPYYEDPSSTSNKVMITGYDTLERIEQLYQSQMRIPVPVKTVQMTVGGIKTLVGAEVGLDVATYKGVPIIPDANVLQDTISRIYGVDLDNLWLGTLQPVTYLESSDYQAIDKFATEGVYYMEGQIVCVKFKSQFKVRDLK